MSSAIAGSQSTNASMIHLIGAAENANNSGYFGFHYAGAGSNDNYLKFGGYAADNLMVIKMNGNVGIGTDSPDSTLDLGSASQGRALTLNSYDNVWGEYSSGGLHLASNYYGNTTANTYLTSTTANFGAAGIRISGTSGSNNGGEISFYVNPET